MNPRSRDAPHMEKQTERVAIVCESTACLPPGLVQRYRIGVLPIPFVFGIETCLDGVDLTAEQFYEKLALGRTPPATSPPSPGEYVQAWRAAAHDAGGADAVVAVTVDSKISTLQRSAQQAEELAEQALRGTRVVVVDSRSAGMGQGFVALAAARAAAACLPLEQVVAAECISRRVRLVVTLDTLEYQARASRIPQVAAILGGVLAIKPIIQIAGGDIRPVARVRTRRRAIEPVFEQMRQHVPEGQRTRGRAARMRSCRGGRSGGTCARQLRLRGGLYYRVHAGDGRLLRARVAWVGLLW
jgi:DegV family protein with EDD domain